MKYILLGLFSFIICSLQAQTQEENNQLWKQVYQHYLNQDLHLDIKIKRTEEKENKITLLDSSSIFFLKKGSNTLYRSQEQDILTTAQYYVWVSKTDSIVSLRDKNNEQIQSTILQLEKLDSVLQISPLQTYKKDNYIIFTLGREQYKTQIHVHQSEKLIHKIVYTYQSGASKIHTEVSYENGLPSSSSFNFDIENYVIKKRKGWKLNESYKNYTLVVE